MNEFERRKRDAETVEIVSEVVMDDRARRQAGQAAGGADADFGDRASADGGSRQGFGDGARFGDRGPGGPYDGGFGQARAGGGFGDMPSAAEERATLRTLSHILYALYVVNLFTFGMAGIVAVIIDYVRRPAMRGTVYASHSVWRTRSFWGALLGYMIGGAMIWTHFGAVLVILTSIWYIYRCVKGWLRLLEDKPVTGGWF
jgi:uncharacterized membrane protein